MKRITFEELNEIVEAINRERGIASGDPRSFDLEHRPMGAIAVVKFNDRRRFREVETFKTYSAAFSALCVTLRAVERSAA